MKRPARRLRRFLGLHVHRWLEDKLAGVGFRYCPNCGRLERLLGLRWEEYPRRMVNPLLDIEVESLGYHRIIRDLFDPGHEIPVVEDPFDSECWVCGRRSENLAVEWAERPEFNVNICWECYERLPPEVDDFHAELRKLKEMIGA